VLEQFSLGWPGGQSRTVFTFDATSYLSGLRTDTTPNMSEQNISNHFQSQDILNASQSTQNGGQDFSMDANMTAGESLTKYLAYTQLKLFKDQDHMTAGGQSGDGHQLPTVCRRCHCKVGRPFCPGNIDLIVNSDKSTSGEY
jgi:hypothetical protein